MQFVFLKRRLQRFASKTLQNDSKENRIISTCVLVCNTEDFLEELYSDFCLKRFEIAAKNQQCLNFGQFLTLRVLNLRLELIVETESSKRSR